MKLQPDQIAELFPDITHHPRHCLRDKVAAVWSEALTTGCGGKGWTFDEILRHPVHAAGRQDRSALRRTPQQLRQAVHRDRESAEGRLRRPHPREHRRADRRRAAGGCGQDARVRQELRRAKSIKGHFGDMLRHPFSGVALCYKHGLPPEVMHIIATHSHEGDKVERTIESWIFHHADFIDFDIAKVLGKKAK